MSRKENLLIRPMSFWQKESKNVILLTRQIRSTAPESIILPSDRLPYPGRKRCAQIEFAFHRDSNSFRTKRFQIKLRLAESVYLSSAPCKTGLFCRFCTLFRRNVPLEGPRREGQHDATCWPIRRELLFCNTRPFGPDSP